MFDLKNSVPASVPQSPKKGFDLANSKPVQDQSSQDQTKEFLKKGLNTGIEAAKSFFPAVGQGVRFKTSDTPLGESVMNPETSIQKTARKAGEFTGKALPFAAATLLAGPVGTAVAGAGLPLLAEPVAGAASMAAYEGAKNLATKGLPDTGPKVGQLAKDVGLGAVGGGVMGGGGYLLGKVADFLGNKMPAKIYNSIVRVTKGQALQDIRQGDYELIGGDLANLPGFTGTKQTMIEKATNKIDELQSKIDAAIAPVANQPAIMTADVIKPLEELSVQYSKMPGYGERKQVVDGLIQDAKDKYGVVLTLGDAQEFKKGIWHEIKNPEFAKLLETNPLFVRTQRLLGSGLRGELALKLPALAPLNAEEGIYLGARQALQEEMARDRTKFSESFIAPLYETASTRIAQGAKATLKTGAKARDIVSNIANPSAGVGLSELISKVQQKGKK